MERSEAIKIVREYYPSSGKDLNEALETLIPELKESEDERIKNFLIGKFREIGEVWHEYSTKDIIAWLEKQGSQNLANSEKTCKDEPKFKVGDWVILTAGDSSTTLQIVNVDTNKKLYWFSDNSYLPIVDDDCLHLWTIQDAKEGDVLATEDFIFIFKNIDNGNGVHYYCHYEICKHENDNQFGIALPQSLMGRVGNNISHFSPATQEQRDLLFQKMKDAGYEWDAEKKEVRKVEQNPAWSEEDIATISRVISIVKWAAYSDHSHPILNDKGATELVERLNSLKERYTWMPSDEQMKALGQAVKYQVFANPKRKEAFEALFNDLKKLKE